MSRPKEFPRLHKEESRHKDPYHTADRRPRRPRKILCPRVSASSRRQYCSMRLGKLLVSHVRGSSYDPMNSFRMLLERRSAITVFVHGATDIICSRFVYYRESRRPQVLVAGDLHLQVHSVKQQCHCMAFQKRVQSILLESRHL